MTGAELKAQVDAEMATNGGDELAAVCTVFAPYLSAGGKVTAVDPPLGQSLKDNENPG